jgi:Lon protease-like protein
MGFASCRASSRSRAWATEPSVDKAWAAAEELAGGGGGLRAFPRGYNAVMENFEIDWLRPVPLLPLPNCVLFPGVVQPLHIFEPRYKTMVADALDGSGLLALALLKEGWEPNYYDKPLIHSMTCIGKIVAHEKVEDGKYNLLLHGVARARVIGEEHERPYRLAKMEAVEFPAPESPPTAALQFQRKVLRELFSKTALKELTVASSLEAFTLVQDVATKQRLLEELDPLKRGELLMRELILLAKMLEGQRPHQDGQEWPPTCSSN